MKLAPIVTSRSILVCILVAGCMASAGLVLAQSAPSYQAQLEKWTGMVAELQRKDEGETAGDIELIRSWIGQGQALVASDKLEQVGPLIERVQALSQYVAVKQLRLVAEGEATATEKKAKDMQTAAQKAQKAASQSHARMKELESAGY